MSDPARQPSEYQNHSVRWAGDDWQRIMRAAEMLAERDHLDLTPTDIIRAATRRYLDELLHTETAKAS